jgi:hypothetical protein
MRKLITYSTVVLTILLHGNELLGQQRFFPLENFYRDRLYGASLNQKDTLPQANTVIRYNGSSFFPQSERQLVSVDELVENRKHRKWLGQALFQRHFIDIRKPDYRISIDPILDMSAGRNFRDTATVNYFQNTRGLRIQADILNRVYFFTELRENQQRFLAYQADYINTHGEYYPSASSYYQLNGFVPGAARTKPFKENAYDFAYATGGVSVHVAKFLDVSLGNNPHFVGSGYRSLLLSEHSSNYPYVRFSYRINKKLSGEAVYAQQLNLIRSVIQTSDTERLYEKKGYTALYFTYKPIEALSISLFEGTNWDRGDSATIRRVHGLFYNPVPLVNSLVLGSKGERSGSITGLNVLGRLPWNIHVYGQVAIDNWKKITPAYQIGLRWSTPFSVKNLYAQVEFNHVPMDFYNHPNARLSYTHNNMPLAHPMGGGFNELVFRANYEWKRIGLISRTNYYQTSFNPLTQRVGTPVWIMNPMPVDATDKGTILIQQIDLVYRFNRMNNFQVFGTLLLRNAQFEQHAHQTFFVGVGIRTQLSNQYLDF